MNSDIKTGLALGIIIVAGLGILGVTFLSLDQEVQSTNFVGTGSQDKSGFKRAPDLVGVANYLNTTPEELSEKIKGSVVLYDIWTYSCINCIRTLPHIVAWNDKYADQGLLIIGVHSPEFEFEKDLGNVETAVKKYGIKYPVVMDNDKEIWKAFENRFWPRKYIADHEGFLRYDKIGEGGYQETERVIQKLLEERAAALGMQVASASSLVDIKEFEHSLFRTPELYFGYEFAQNRNQLGSAEGFKHGETVSYLEPNSIELHKFYPIGDWTNYKESMELVSDTGKIKLRYNAKNVNIVTANTAELEIYLDGKPLTAEHAGTDITDGNMLQITKDDLYNIISSETSSTHLIEINAKGAGFQIFTFTFG